MKWRVRSSFDNAVDGVSGFRFFMRWVGRRIFDMGDVDKKGRSNAVKSDDRREIWSFFSGAMGLDLGLEAAKLAPTLAVEIDPVFCRTIRANRPELDLIEGDVSKLTATTLRAHRQFDGEVFLMAGGPPCQPFSSGSVRR